MYEKALIERYIEENGTDPISGEALTKEDLVEVKASEWARARGRVFLTARVARRRVLRDNRRVGQGWAQGKAPILRMASGGSIEAVESGCRLVDGDWDPHWPCREAWR